jgi:uncharacterized protein (TIGR00730 family)
MGQLDELSDEQRGAVESLLDRAGAVNNRLLLGEIVATGVNLARDDADALDLKIIAAALAEMREAFDTFQPYRAHRKVSIFGSARTAAHDPLYAQAKAVAAALAADGWMVITGAGPGIMQAAMEGAGQERSFGVTIRLPWEGGANPVIAGDDKLVSMKYFFTRKLMLIKESLGFICMPGGFGTMDETFELLTLTQTGKGVPVPIVFLDTPGGSFWSHWAEVIQAQLVDKGFVSATDTRLFLVTDDVDVAVTEVNRFYANFDSMRWVGSRLVLRMLRAPRGADLAALNTEFADLLTKGAIETTGPTKAERVDADRLELERVVLSFDPRRASRLRSLIDRVNEF